MNTSRAALLVVGTLSVSGCATKAPLVRIDKWIPSALEDIQRGLCNQHNLPGQPRQFDFVPIGNTPGVKVDPAYSAQTAGAAGGDSHVTLTVQAVVGYQVGVGPTTMVPVTGQVSGSDTRTITIKLVNTEKDWASSCAALQEKAKQVQPPLEVYQLQVNGDLTRAD